MFLISQPGSPLLGRKADQNHFCKVVIFGRCFLGFYSVSNLIVFFQSFPCMFVRFNVRIECEKLWQTVKKKTIHDWLTSGQPAKSHMRSVYQMLKSQVPEGISRLGQPVRCTTGLFLYPHYALFIPLPTL